MTIVLRHIARFFTLFIFSVSFHLNAVAIERAEREQLANKIVAQFVPAGESTNSWVMRMHRNLATKDEVRTRFREYIKNDEDLKRVGEIHYLALFKAMLGEDFYFRSLANSESIASKYEIRPTLLNKFRGVHYDFLVENFDLLELKEIEKFVETTAGKKILNIDGLNSQIAIKMIKNFQDIQSWVANEAVRLTLQDLGKK